MAAAAIGIIAPILAPLIPVIGNDIISLITGLVHKEAPIAQAANPVAGTGAVRFADVFTAVMQAVVNAHAAGQIAGAIPDDGLVKVIIQAVVTSMKLPGGLLGSPVAVVSADGSQTLPPSGTALVLKAGQSITITVQ
jgi:hypothetical protein